MNRNNYSPLFIPFWILAFICAFTLQANAQLSNMFADTLNKTLAKRAAQYQLKGVTASVVFSDGSIWKSAEGYADNTPLSPDMLFEMGSNTKTFTAALILLLEEEGKLSIDDTLYKYLSPIKHVTNGVTLYQLLTHSAGLFSYTEHPDFFQDINTTDESVKWNIDTILKKYMSPPLNQPGETFRYCNTNFILLGKVIEAIEGKPYHEVLREKILNKHGLKHTYLSEYEPHTEFKAETWLTNGTYFGTRFTSFLSSAWAAGGIISTPDDLALWAHKLYGGEVLSPASFKKMTTKLQINGNTYPMGLSMFFSNFQGKEYWGHGGTTLQDSEMEYSVSSKFSCVVVSNEQNNASEVRAIKRSIYEVLESTLPPLSTAKINKNKLSIYPNPSNGQINIEVDNPTENNIVNIFTISGKLVKQYKNLTTKMQVHKADIGEGIFIVELKNTSTNAATRNRIVLY